jgi:hypothetical protein
LSDYQPIFSDEQIRAAAAAIANARGARRGVPHVINILELLPPKLLDEVMEDAKVALEAGARFSVRDVQIRPSTEIQMAHDVLWHVVMEKTPLQLDAAELLLARAGLDVLCWAQSRLCRQPPHAAPRDERSRHGALEAPAGGRGWLMPRHWNQLNRERLYRLKRGHDLGPLRRLAKRMRLPLITKRARQHEPVT